MAKFKYTGSYIKAGGEDQPKESLNQLAAHPNPAVRRRLAENPGTAIEVLARLAEDPEPDVRAGLAWNQEIPHDILIRLCQDSDVNVRLALTENHRLPKSALALLAEDESPYVQHAARRAVEVFDLETELAKERFQFQAGDEAKLGELLVAAGLLDASALIGLLERAKTKGIPFGHMLIRDCGLSKRLLSRALLLQCSVRTAEITTEQAIAQLQAL